VIGREDFDWKIVTMTIVSTLLMMVDYYHHFIPGWKGWDRTLLYFVVPMVFILIIFRENPKDYGFQLGDWKAGLLLTGGEDVEPARYGETALPGVTDIEALESADDSTFGRRPASYRSILTARGSRQRAGPRSTSFWTLESNMGSARL
jgi:hypothetical protein